MSDLEVNSAFTAVKVLCGPLLGSAERSSPHDERSSGLTPWGALGQGSLVEQHGHSIDQLIGREGLGQEVVGAAHVVGADVGAGGQGGDHQDQRSLDATQQLHRLQDLDPAHPGHQVVQQHDVEGLPRDRLEGLDAVARLADPVAGAVQHQAQEQPEVGVVLGDQDAGHPPPIGAPARHLSRTRAGGAAYREDVGMDDATAILLGALVGGLVAGAVRLPPLLGFLVAGFGLHLLGVEAVPALGTAADLGVTVLLFGVGLRDNREVTEARLALQKDGAGLVLDGAAYGRLQLLPAGNAWGVEASYGWHFLLKDGLDSGSYTVRITAFDESGNEKQRSYLLDIAT